MILTHFTRGVAVLVMPLFLAAPAAGQFARQGLERRVVYDLAFWRTHLYAATDSGVYRLDSPPGVTWTLIGLAGKTVLAVYPHDIGPLANYAITAGRGRVVNDLDSTLLYCTVDSDTAWKPRDEGMDRAEISRIMTLDGYPSPAICGETFAGGDGKIYRRELTGDWHKVFDIGIGQVNVIAVEPATNDVWAGGETGIFAPFIARSTDKGLSWTTTFPAMGGDNACDALAFDPDDPSVVYAGMEGAVIRSTDRGVTWGPAGLEGTPYYFYGLAFDPAHALLYAGGTTGSGDFGLYSAPAGSALWTRIDPPWPTRGIRCMTVVYTPLPETNYLMMGTDGDGVLAYQLPWTSVDDQDGSIAPRMAAYPNPFNASTTLSFSVETRAHRTLSVVDLLGRTVATLVDGEIERGAHTLLWDAASLPSGVYVCRLVGGTTRLSTTLLLLK